MGVTIYFKLRAPPGTDKRRAKEIMTELRECADRYGRAGRVDAVPPLREDAKPCGTGARGASSRCRTGPTRTTTWSWCPRKDTF